MEVSEDLGNEIEDLDVLIAEIEEKMVEHKEMAFDEVDVLKKALSPSGKISIATKTQGLEAVKNIGATGPATA